MLFISQLLNGKIKDQTGRYIGKVIDVVIQLSKNSTAEFPPLVGLVAILADTNERCFIKPELISEWNYGQIKLAKAIARCEALPNQEDLVYLCKSVLDKQIVDLTGVRVVRVNDLQFGEIHNIMSLIAIDISSLGLLRRLNIPTKPFAYLSRSNLLEWKNVHIFGNQLQLSIGVKELVKLHPADIANLVEKLNLHHGSLLLQSLDQATAARVLEEVQPEIQQMLIKNLGSDRAADIMSKMSTDELVDLIKLLPTKSAQEIVNHLPIDSKTQKMKKILEYDEDTAGGLMTTEYIHTHLTATVQSVIDEIKRASPHYHSIHYVYVIDEQDKFVGVVSLRGLIITDKDCLIANIMKTVDRSTIVKIDDSLTTVAEIMTKYNFMSVAVLDNHNKLRGVITVDDIMRHFLPHA